MLSISSQASNYNLLYPNIWTKDVSVFVDCEFV